MQFYYLDQNGKQAGPLDIYQLISVGITPYTKVWTEGMDTWKPAKEVEQLRSLIGSMSQQMPPPRATVAPMTQNQHRHEVTVSPLSNININYKRNRLYFYPKQISSPRWIAPFILIGFGVAMFAGLFRFIPQDESRIIALILMFIGVVLIIIISSSNTTVSDQEYDSAIKNIFNKADTISWALDKLGLDEDQVNEIQPVYFHDFRTIKVAAEKIGADGKLRTSKYEATVLFFSNTQMYMYQQVLDMLDGTQLEYTMEYFYKDIVCFSTFTKTYKNAKGVSTFQLIVPNDEFYCSMGNISDADAVIGAVKQKLREKRG